MLHHSFHIFGKVRFARRLHKPNLSRAAKGDNKKGLALTPYRHGRKQPPTPGQQPCVSGGKDGEEPCNAGAYVGCVRWSSSPAAVARPPRAWSNGTRTAAWWLFPRTATTGRAVTAIRRKR